MFVYWMWVFTSTKLEMTPPMPSKYGFAVVFRMLSSTAADALMYDGIGIFKSYANKLLMMERGEDERPVSG